MTLPVKQYPTAEAEEAARARALARDPATSVVQIRALAIRAQQGERRIAEALAANPATPLDLLATLIPLAPAAFCRNPIAPLIPLEQPDFLKRVPQPGIERMLRCPRAPQVFLDSILESNDSYAPSLQEAVSLHVSRYPSTGDDATEDWQFGIRRYWRHVTNRLDKTSPADALFEAAELGWLPASLLTGLDDPVVHTTYAGLMESARPHQARQMEEGAADPPLDTPGVRNARVFQFVGAAFHARMPPRRLREWVGHLETLDCAIAQSRYATPELLLQLAGSPYTTVRRAALRHRAIPPEGLEIAQRCALGQALSLRGPGRYSARSSFGISPGHLLLRFAASFAATGPQGRSLWHQFARSSFWQERLTAAVVIRQRLNGQPMRRRHQALLRLLAEDGNSLVRASARGRLRGENFTWEP